MKYREIESAVCMTSLLAAVIGVYDEINQASEKKADGAGAEDWTIHQGRRTKEMLSLVRQRYEDRTGSECMVMDNAIALTYIYFRKQPTDRKDHLRREMLKPFDKKVDSEFWEL